MEKTFNSFIKLNNNLYLNNFKRNFKYFFDLFFILILIILNILIIFHLFTSFSSSFSFSSSSSSFNFNYYNFYNKSKIGGPYEVNKLTFFIGNLVCHDSQDGIVYYPKDYNQNSKRKFPLLSFSHGYRAGGNRLDYDYQKLLVGLASWGFIVVAPKSGKLNYCFSMFKDQLRVFDYVNDKKRRHPIFNLVDDTAYYGILGHSMGGESTIISSTFDNYNIGAAAALNPVYNSVVSNVKVPILYGTGSDDIFIPSKEVKLCYDETPNNVSKIYVNILHGTHFDPGRTGKNIWPDYLAAFFTCHLHGNPFKVNNNNNDNNNNNTNTNTTINTTNPITTTDSNQINKTDDNQESDYQKVIMEACDRVYGNNIEKCDLCVCNQIIPIKSCKTNVNI